MQSWRVNSQETLKGFLEYAAQLYAENHYLEFRWTAGKQRSEAQNNALHLWLGRLAKELNDAGLDMRTVLKPEIEIPWTMLSAKDHLWRPIQKAMYQNESTTEPNTVEYGKIYEVLSRHLAEKHNIHVPWPGSEK
jgi:hypothetical protein